MRHLVVVTALLCGTSACGSLPLSPGDSTQAQVEAAIAKVYPSLVRIHVVVLDYAGGREQKFEAAGSGAIVSREGLVVTNHHVAGRATLITCTLSTREEIPATLVATDPLADIAVLKLKLDERKDPTAPVPVARFGDSDALRVGDRVMAMGSPLALSQSVTLGIVSNRDLILSERFLGSFELDGERVGSLVKWIGHDAQIFPGNSGGPLVNLAGEIVGINEIAVGLGGAIPANLARRVVTELEECGECKRSFTGIELQPLLKGAGADSGVLVAGVVEGSPAAKAGVHSGDVLVAYDGSAVSARFDEEIPAVNRRILETPVGANVPLVLRRGGIDVSVRITTESRGKARGDEKELKGWGITATDITPILGLEIRRAPRSGARVSSARDGGPAAGAKPPIQAGDVITQVDGKPVATLGDLVRITDSIVRDRDSQVPTLVAFERHDEKLLTVVKLGPESEDRSLEARKAWFPAAFQVLTTPLAESLGLAGRTGVRLTQVYPGTSAEAAGFKDGDVLVAIDGEPIPAQQPEDQQVFPHLVRQRRIGGRSEFTVLRDGRETKVACELPSRPPEGRELASHRDDTFEFSAREISFRDRVDNRWPGSQKGAVIASADPGGWAAFAGLRSADLVTSIDGRPVEGVPSLEEVMADVAARRPGHVSFHIRRGAHSLFVEVHPAWSPSR